MSGTSSGMQEASPQSNFYVVVVIFINLGRKSALKCKHCLVESAGISCISSIGFWANNSRLSEKDLKRKKKNDIIQNIYYFPKNMTSTIFFSGNILESSNLFHLKSVSKLDSVS